MSSVTTFLRQDYIEKYIKGVGKAGMNILEPVRYSKVQTDDASKVRRIMDDVNKVLRITKYLKTIWPSDNAEYEFLSDRALHKITISTERLNKTILISANYLSDHRLSVMLWDMDINHVKDMIKNSDNSDTFFLGYTSSGKVIFSVIDNE